MMLRITPPPRFILLALPARVLARESEQAPGREPVLLPEQAPGRKPVLLPAPELEQERLREKPRLPKVRDAVYRETLHRTP